MINIKHTLATILMGCSAFAGANAAGVDVTASRGHLETAYIEWNLYTGADMYNVYYKASASSDWSLINSNLVRNYGYYGRADVLGLAAGSYDIKIVATKNETEIAGSETVINNINVKAKDRSGFCFTGNDTPGAYKKDGTLKADTRVVYVHSGNAKTVKLDVKTSSKGSTTTYTGVQQIVYGYQKAYEDRPLCIRIIGELKEADCDQLLSSAEGFQIKGANSYTKMPITIEGVGNDATINGFGFLIRNASYIEVSNLALINFKDDGVSLDTDNSYVWAHNLDIFYGSAGSDADQAKGDGSLDTKGNSQHITVAYNHFWDSGKMALCGMKSESGPNYIDYHHNWFDHSDSRHPRVRTMTVHVWNNYYDGIAKYGVGATSGSNIFVESNYFRQTSRPMMSSLQGTDATGDGTFSGETGGMIKSFGNIFTECPSAFSYITANACQYATSVSSTSFDAYEASARDEKVPSTLKTKSGGTTYSNFDTDNSVMHSYTPNAAIDVPQIVTRYAGRVDGGDLQYVFSNESYKDYNVNSELKSLVNNYKTSLVSIAQFSSTSAAPAKYTLNFYLDKEKTQLFWSTEASKVVLPESTPSMEGYTFVGWGIPAGTAITADTDIYATWSDGKNNVIGGGSDDNGGVETTMAKWDFTTFGDATKTTVKGEGWTRIDDSTDRYKFHTETSPLTGVAEAADLLFNGDVTVSVDATKGFYIQTSAAIYVPATAGQTIKVNFANTGKSNGTRYLIVNGSKCIGSSPDANKKTASVTVTADDLVEIAGVKYAVLQGWSTEDPAADASSAKAFNYFQIEVTEMVGGLQTPEFAFSTSEATIDLANLAAAQYPALNSNTDGEVVFSSTDDEIATVDAATGIVTPIKIGSTTIRAIAKKSETYKSASAQYFIKVVDSSKPTYTVTFMADGMEFAAISGLYAVAYPEEQPAKTGYTFDGWSVAKGKELTADITVDAIFTLIPTYTVTFTVDGATFETASNQTEVQYPDETPVKEGYIFTGWSISEGTKLTANTEVAAQFKQLTADTYLQYLTDLKTYSNDVFTVSGNTSNSKGSATYNNITSSNCIKMESATVISFNAPADMQLVIVTNAIAGKAIQVDGKTYKTDADGIVTVDVKAGAHTIKKGDAIFIFFLNLISKHDQTPTAIPSAEAEVISVTYFNLTGKMIPAPCKGICIKVEKLSNGKSISTKMLNK